MSDEAQLPLDLQHDAEPQRETAEELAPPEGAAAPEQKSALAAPAPDPQVAAEQRSHGAASDVSDDPEADLRLSFLERPASRTQAPGGDPDEPDDSPEAELLAPLILPNPLPQVVPRHKDGFAAASALRRLDPQAREGARATLTPLADRLRALRNKAAGEARGVRR